MEREAYRHFSLLPAQFYALTPRQYYNLLKGKEAQDDDRIHFMALQAIMYRKAMNKRSLKFTDLTGKRETRNQGRDAQKVVDLEKKRREMDALFAELGPPSRK